MSVSKNDDIQLYIDGFTAEGSGVGRKDGLAVFVPGAAQGDTVTAHIIKVKKNYAIGKISEIITPSKDRQISDCPVFPRCGGCVYRHISYEAEKNLKRTRVEDCFKRIGHLDIKTEDIIGGARTRYRNKAQYPVRYENGKLNIGFFSERTHRVINCEDCLLEPEEFAAVVAVIRSFIIKNNISVYNETTGKGLFRHIYLRKAFATDQIMVTAVINGDTLPEKEKFIKLLKDSVPEITSIYLNINKENSNVILGKKCVHIYGEKTLNDILCGLKISLDPMAFYQVNHDSAEKLYAKTAELINPKPTDTVIDLYCGAGTIGLTVAKKIKTLIGVEIVPEAIENALLNAKNNDIKNAEFICGDAEQAAQQLEERGIKPNTVILDPPRKGCGASLPHTVKRMNPDKIVYISCDPATLARDCAVFAELGYIPSPATPVDMFPATAHVETVILLTAPLYSNKNADSK